jgi:hypothetical protein
MILTPEIRAYLRLRPKPPKGAELLFPTAPGAVFSAAVNAKVPIFLRRFAQNRNFFCFLPSLPMNLSIPAPKSGHLKERKTNVF